MVVLANKNIFLSELLCNPYAVVCQVSLESQVYGGNFVGRGRDPAVSQSLLLCHNGQL